KGHMGSARTLRVRGHQQAKAAVGREGQGICLVHTEGRAEDVHQRASPVLPGTPSAREGSSSPDSSLSWTESFWLAMLRVSKMRPRKRPRGRRREGCVIFVSTGVVSGKA